MLNEPKRSTFFSFFALNIFHRIAAVLASSPRTALSQRKQQNVHATYESRILAIRRPSKSHAVPKWVCNFHRSKVIANIHQTNHNFRMFSFSQRMPFMASKERNFKLSFYRLNQHTSWRIEVNKHKTDTAVTVNCGESYI